MTWHSPEGRQLLLEFPRIDPSQRPLITTGSYAAASAALGRWRNWPEGQLALTGPAFAGKTRLLHAWAIEAGAAVVGGVDLAAADMDEISNLSFNALAIDDAGQGSDGHGLLAALNLCRSRGAPVLLAGEGEPARWYAAPPDLRSRLAAMPVVAIGEPDDATLSERLKEECARRHLILPDLSVDYLAHRMQRSWTAIAAVADQIERTPGRAFTSRSARNVLKALGMDPG